MSETAPDQPEQQQDSPEDLEFEHAEEEREPEEPPLAMPERHVDNRALVFPDLRIFYVPVPKAGCTAIMWALAQTAGLDQDLFYGSFYREVSRSLTIHDLSRWPDEFLYAKLPQEKKDEIFAADDWMRFTVVRHPFRRLWSAWQSKILLNEPQFTEKFGSQTWFPRSVESADGVLKMFRQFLQALEEEGDLVNADVHWAPQVPLTSHGEVPYTHIGRVEKMGDTVKLVREHIESLDGPSLPDLRRENVTPLPYVDELFDEADIEILGRVFADDMRAFEYEPPTSKVLQTPCPPSWIAAVDAVIPALEELRNRNERVGDLYGLFKERRAQFGERIRQMRERITGQKNRLDQQKQRIEEQGRRNKRQGELRAEERRRNERLQKRLRQTSKELNRLKNSASWRYTAPLRRLSRLKRKATGRKGRE